MRPPHSAQHLTAHSRAAECSTFLAELCCCAYLLHGRITESTEEAEACIASMFRVLGLLGLLLRMGRCSLRHAKDYEEVCGWEWQEDYIRQHRAIMSGEKRGRYVVAIPVKAGMADMIHGYISAFMWALISDRAFLIEHVGYLDDDTQRTIEFAYHPVYVNWTSPLLPRHVYKCLLPPYHGECKGPNEGTTFFNGQNAVPYRLVFGVNGGFPLKFDKTNLIDEYKDDDLLITVSNRGATVRIFDNPYHKEFLLNKLKLTPQTAFPCFFHLLFHMNRDVCDEACMHAAKVLHKAGKEGNHIRIGIHVRNPGGGAPEHFYCADSLIERYKEKGYKTLVVLVTTSASLQAAAQNKYGESLILPAGQPKEAEVVHDRSEGTWSRENSAELDRRGVIDSARDYYILSLTDIQVLSRESGFGVVGSMLGLRREHVMYRMELKGEQRQCSSEPEGDNITVFANEWSGL